MVGMADIPEAGRPAERRARGDRRRSDELLPEVYDDLRSLAAARIARLPPGQTLQPTALVHEAYLRLAGDGDHGWQERAHFFGAAARAMRNVVADHLERKGSLKRGGAFKRIEDPSTALLSCTGPSDELLALEDALRDFEREYPRKAEVVTLSVYGGLTAEQIGEVLQVSARTIERDWKFAKAWLNRHLSAGEVS